VGLGLSLVAIAQHRVVRRRGVAMHGEHLRQR
jgi:hypothetical protein